MKLLSKIVMLISIPFLLNAQEFRGFSLEFGGAFLHDDTYFDNSVGKEIMEETYYGGFDFGVSYQLSKRQTVSLFTNLYFPLEGLWGVGFIYGDKEKFAIGPTISFTESLYEPSLGAELYVKSIYLRAGVDQYRLSDENSVRYDRDYGYKTWISIGYSFKMLRLNRRIFE